MNEMRMGSAIFPACPAKLGLYAIVPNAEWVKRVLEYGVDTVQLRIKSEDTNHLAQEVASAVQAVQQIKPELPLFINDHWQLAIDYGAYGVHLGQEDLDNVDLEKLRMAGLRLGISTHNVAEMHRAHQLRPSYIAMGAVYPTTAKKMPTAPLGLERLKEYAYLMSDYPLVAIGGIHINNASEVLKCGVGSIAVMGAIIDALDPAQAVVDLKAVVMGADAVD
jgi:thiamine-phosphate pyrophosphorylase